MGTKPKRKRAKKPAAEAAEAVAASQESQTESQSRTNADVPGDSAPPAEARTAPTAKPAAPGPAKRLPRRKASGRTRAPRKSRAGKQAAPSAAGAPAPQPAPSAYPPAGASAPADTASENRRHAAGDSAGQTPPHQLPPEELAELEQVAERAFESENHAKALEAEPIFADGQAEPAAHNQYLRPGIPPMYIVMVTPELSTVAKVGGLADVVFGLSRELQLRNNTVEIVLPKYDCLRWHNIYALEPCYHDLWVPWFDGAIHCTVYQGFVHGRKCYFIEPHSQDHFFDRGRIYGESDDIMRFAFFSRAAMEFLHQSGKHPEIIHVHDWQTALVPVLLYEIYQHIGMRHSRVCFTIHNFKHQGICGDYVLRATGLHRPEYFMDDTRLGWHHPGSLNLMKGGIVYSNFVNTVSPTYAGEAKDRGGAFGLEGTLQTHAVKYGGILNGIDYDVWNPETDPHIPSHYTVDTLDRKYANKKALRERLLLADNDKPIIAYIGRLDPQKGLDLVRHALFYSVNHGAQFILLGSGSEPGIDDYFRRIKHEINDNPDSHLEIGFDEDLAHLIYAGADMIVVPSRFEPCGLTQLIGMRYGTIPIVRAVGGLADTVFDKDYSERPLHERNGYVFHNDDDLGVESALARAIACYYMYPEHFRQLIINAMRWDYSWNVPGQHYLNVYDYIRDK